LRIHVDAPWTLAARADRARAEREAERARSAVTVRDVLGEIRELYAELAFGELMHTMLDQQLVVLRERNRVLTDRLEHATATRLEYLLAEHDLADLESTKADVDLDLLRARAKIARLIGIPSDRAWHPIANVAQLRAVQTNLDADRLAVRALASQPALAEAAARANAAGASAYEEKTRRWPSLEWLQLERATSPETEWSVGVAVTLPLLSLNSGKIKVATAEQRRYLRARDRIANDTLLRVGETIALVEATGKHARELAARLEPLDKEIAALVEREKASAVADPLKLLLLEERHVRAQRDLLDASYAHRRAQIQLEALIGDAP
jgi:outer membrane protein TolC